MKILSTAKALKKLMQSYILSVLIERSYTVNQMNDISIVKKLNHSLQTFILRNKIIKNIAVKSNTTGFEVAGYLQIVIMIIFH